MHIHSHIVYDIRSGIHRTHGLLIYAVWALGIGIVFAILFFVQSVGGMVW